MNINSFRLPANTFVPSVVYGHSDQCCLVLADGDCDCGAEEAIQDEMYEELGE
jgi:hypothetical protein